MATGDTDLGGDSTGREGRIGVGGKDAYTVGGRLWSKIVDTGEGERPLFPEVVGDGYSSKFDTST